MTVKVRQTKYDVLDQSVPRDCKQVMAPLRSCWISDVLSLFYSGFSVRRLQNKVGYIHIDFYYFQNSSKNIWKYVDYIYQIL